MHNSNLSVISARPERLHSHGRGQHHIVGCRDSLLDVLMSRRIIANQITAVSIISWFIKGCPQLYPVPKPFKAYLRIVGVGHTRITVQPSALFLQVLWQVPVKNSYHGCDSIFQTGINEPVVKINALLVHFPFPVFDNSGPGQ